MAKTVVQCICPSYTGGLPLAKYKKKKKKTKTKTKLPQEMIDHIKSEIKDSGQLEDYFRDMLKVALESMLEGELDSHLGYEKNGFRPEDSTNSRNGKTQKKLKTDLGEIDLEVPRDRDSSFEPHIVKKRQRILDKIEDLIISLYAHGTSTRDISSQIEKLYGQKVTEQTISRITDRLLPKIKEWRNRPLESIYTILWMDGLCVKVRSDGQVKTKTVYLVIGLNAEGEKDVLGMWIAETESASFWLHVLSDLQARGVQDVLAASIDNLSGFAEAVESTFPGCQVQSCVIHQIRNSLKYVPWKDRRKFASELRKVYTAPTLEAAEEALEELAKKWEDTYPLIIRSWQKNWTRLTTFFNYPPAIRKILYTTNTIEALNRGIRKFIKTKSVFPTDDAAYKAVYFAIENVTEKWSKVKNWQLIISQFAILFPDRLKIGL